MGQTIEELSTPTTPSTATSGVEGVEGQREQSEYAWRTEDGLGHNFREIGKLLASLLVELYQRPEGGLLLVEGGQVRTIASAMDLAPILIDTVCISVTKNGKYAGDRVSDSILNNALRSRSFLSNFRRVEEVVTTPVVLHNSRAGSLVASYTSPAQLPKMMAAAQEAGLDWWWQVICLNPSTKAASTRQGLVRNLYRPVAIFSKPGAKVRASKKWGLDVITVKKEERLYHPWQQPLGESISLLMGLARPGYLVADLCAGSGTTGEACVDQGLRWVGCEIDKDTLKIASRRINEALKARGKLAMPTLARATV